MKLHAYVYLIWNVFYLLLQYGGKVIKVYGGHDSLFNSECK